MGPHCLGAHPTPLPCPPIASGSQAASLAPSFPICQVGSAVTRDCPVRGTKNHGLAVSRRGRWNHVPLLFCHLLGPLSHERG